MMLAWLDARENHCIQPTSNPTNSPNASRVNRYGPPVASNRLLSSAKHNATDNDRTPISTNPIGLHAPICAATWAGHRKIAPPITWLTPIAVRSQRPSARVSVVIETRLYHEHARLQGSRSQQPSATGERESLGEQLERESPGEQLERQSPGEQLERQSPGEQLEREPFRRADDAHHPSAAVLRR